MSTTIYLSPVAKDRLAYENIDASVAVIDGYNVTIHDAEAFRSLLADVVAVEEGRPLQTFEVRCDANAVRRLLAQVEAL